MATPESNLFLSGLARRLVEKGLLTEEKARQAYAEAQRQKIPYGAYLVQNKLADAREVALEAAKEFGVPLFDLDAMDMEQIPVGIVDVNLIQKHHALPLFKRSQRLFVAVSDPTNLPALDEFKFNAGMPTEPVLVEEDKLAKAIDQVVEAQDTTLQKLAEVGLENLEVEGEEERGAVSEEAIQDAPIVRYVNKILIDAIKRGASDIHFEPYEKLCRIRYRIDGVLYEIATPPVTLSDRLVARVKVMANLDISERRIPQDGRIKLRLSRSHAIDFRVNTCPTLFGEKVVLRILDPSSAQIGIDALGFEPDQKETFLQYIHRPQGMILVTGPTGSGKTVTLYTALNILNTPEKNISTAEDPVEIYVNGINQVHINPKVGLTFAEALRAFLRQDPDIIMVGEVRDLETADIAIKAAQTGHLVLSTLHTNDAPQTLTRLVNMGVPPYNIAASVNLIIAQRLARKLCNHCKLPLRIPREELLREGFHEEEVDKIKIYRPVGCDQCTHGYKGRTGIFQVMPVSETMGRIIMEGGNAIQLAEQARKEGVITLREAGLNKVRLGITSLDEVNRVTT